MSLLINSCKSRQACLMQLWLRNIVLSSWLEYLAGKNILNEIPSYTSHLPTIVAEGVSVKVAEPKTRETCLGGIYFLIGTNADV
ncbi:hypothetical protein NL676_031299 [Syzygium grande]|nr:hypothetical protein NL676_031299 [Syzygium grande]